MIWRKEEHFATTEYAVYVHKVKGKKISLRLLKNYAIQAYGV